MIRDYYGNWRGFDGDGEDPQTEHAFWVEELKIEGKTAPTAKKAAKAAKASTPKAKTSTTKKKAQTSADKPIKKTSTPTATTTKKAKPKT